MAKKNKNTFAKRQREMKRMRKAAEKMARRQQKTRPLTDEGMAPMPNVGSNAPTQTEDAAPQEPAQ